MTVIELAGLISVVGAAIAASIADGHTGFLTRITAFVGGGVFGLAVYLAALLLTAGTLARTRMPEAEQPEGSRLQRSLAVCLLLSIPASPIVAILASSQLTSWLLSL
jgi:preprotein translocase subunit SecG